MNVEIAYGEDGLVIEVPDDAVVLRPAELPGLPDEAEAVRDALRSPVAGPPLAELVQPGRTVAVVFPDLTRPFPHRTVLPPLLAAVEAAGARPDDVVLVCATGSHRQATPGEMAALIGPELVARYRVHDHDSMHHAHVLAGHVDGAPVWLDRVYADADVRITTGFVEPHFFAGFSGGPKAVCPGVASLETILAAHAPALIADPRATWTVLDGNPVHEFVTRGAALCPPHLSLDVAINGARQVTAVFAGTLPDAHRAACAFVGDTAVVRVEEPFDVVVTTNAGFPLDRNLYQAVKGMSAGARVLREGGTLVLAAECRDGLPEQGAFGRLLAAAPDAAALLGVGSAHDQWTVQVLGRVLRHGRVLVHSAGLSDEQVRSAHCEPVADVSAAVTEAVAAHRGGARVGVLPLGPLTVGTVTAGNTGFTEARAEVRLP